MSALSSLPDSGWCALSTDSDGNYQTWAYCGWGNYNEDHCSYPFTYGEVEYWQCAGQDSSSPWCATAVYDNSVYYSYKTCEASDLEGDNSVQWGTTVTADGCVFPFNYLGVTYLECTSAGSSSPWCATSVNDAGNYINWQYCETSYGSSEDTDTSTESAATSNQITFSGEYCVPMIYGGVYYDACTSDDYGRLWLIIFLFAILSLPSAWCSTKSDSDLNYQTWGYCKLGDGSNCYFPFKSYSGGYDNYECIDKESYGGYGWSVSTLQLYIVGPFSDHNLLIGVPQLTCYSPGAPPRPT